MESPRNVAQPPIKHNSEENGNKNYIFIEHLA